MEGNCKLCNQLRELKNSHVLSRLAYVRYVMNEQDSGSSIKLDTLRKNNHQLKRKWFCFDCEKLFGEDFAARFLDRLAVDSTDCRYKPDLLRFVVSCSYRTCRYQLEHEHELPVRRRFVPAFKAWESFLLGESEDIGDFTQHAFVIRDEMIWHERLGMYVSYPHNLVFTQVGPLMCFGVLGPQPPEDKKTLRQSLVKPAGGVLCNIIAHAVNGTLTQSMRYIIDFADEHCNWRVTEFSKSRNRKPTPWSEYVNRQDRRAN